MRCINETKNSINSVSTNKIIMWSIINKFWMLILSFLFLKLLLRIKKYNISFLFSPWESNNIFKTPLYNLLLYGAVKFDTRSIMISWLGRSQLQHCWKQLRNNKNFLKFFIKWVHDFHFKLFNEVSLTTLWRHFKSIKEHRPLHTSKHTFFFLIFHVFLMRNLIGIIIKLLFIKYNII